MVVQHAKDRSDFTIISLIILFLADLNLSLVGSGTWFWLQHQRDFKKKSWNLSFEQLKIDLDSRVKPNILILPSQHFTCDASTFNFSLSFTSLLSFSLQPHPCEFYCYVALERRNGAGGWGWGWGWRTEQWHKTRCHLATA